MTNGSGLSNLFLLLALYKVWSHAMGYALDFLEYTFRVLPTSKLLNKSIFIVSIQGGVLCVPQQSYCFSERNASMELCRHV